MWEFVIIKRWNIGDSIYYHNDIFTIIGNQSTDLKLRKNWNNSIVPKGYAPWFFVNQIFLRKKVTTLCV